MSKVHTFRSLCPVIILLGLVGCRPDDETAPVEQDVGTFGDAYEIMTNETSAAPDEPPALISDTLKALISYSGGCADHGFELDSEIRRDTTRLWIRHDDGGDDCEAMITDRVELVVSTDALESSTILLQNPNAEIPFVLRWGDASGGGGNGAD